LEPITAKVPQDECLFFTRTLGDLTVTRTVDYSRATTTLLFRHKALDLVVNAVIDNRVSAGINILSVYGEIAEKQMLQMIRDRFNPPPTPASAPSYAIQQSGGSAVAYLRRDVWFSGSCTWEKDIANATLFNKPATAVGFLSECVAAFGQPFNSSVTVVRVDILTQTMEKRVATVLK
jgi:hypothetical protein